MNVISIDVGTTVIKAVGYVDGRETVVVRRPTTVERPRPGWAEQDMAGVWQAVADAVRETVARLGHAPVEHVAVTAQGDGAWLVGADGEPTGPAVLWNDGRAGTIVDAWARDGRLTRAFGVNGSLTSSGLPNAILSWFRQHDPDRLRRSATVLTCGSWVFQRLTGETGVDESDASAPFLDIRSRRYSPDLMRLYELEWAEPLLPEVRGDDRRSAGLTPEAARSTGLRPGTPVILAPYDIVATALGVGAVRPGQACSILGTTLCTEVVTDHVPEGGPTAGLTVASGIADRWLRAFPTFAGGEIVTWACRMMGVADPVALGELAAASEPGARGLVFLPYLSPAGERAPFLDPRARGSVLGMSLEHSRADLARAVLEGLTLVVRDCLIASATRPEELRVCGGGAANGVWLQMIADVTGLPVTRSADSEVGARGAFIVAAAATGAAADVEEAAERYVTLRESVLPDPGRAESYAELYEDFLALRGVAGTAWSRLADLRDRLATPARGTVAATDGVPSGATTPSPPVLTSAGEAPGRRVGDRSGRDGVAVST